MVVVNRYDHSLSILLLPFRNLKIKNKNHQQNKNNRQQRQRQKLTRGLEEKILRLPTKSDQATDQPTNRPTDQPTNRPKDLSTTSDNTDY